jgi:hypothetical protein
MANWERSGLRGVVGAITRDVYESHTLVPPTTEGHWAAQRLSSQVYLPRLLHLLDPAQGNLIRSFGC